VSMSVPEAQETIHLARQLAGSPNLFVSFGPPDPKVMVSAGRRPSRRTGDRVVSLGSVMSLAISTGCVDPEGREWDGSR
jgi:hypothetical protein